MSYHYINTFVMKIKLIICVFCFLSGNLVQSQSLPNSGFETIDTSGFPQEWSSDGHGSGSSSLSHSGNFSMSVWNWYYYAKGFALNGFASSYLWAYQGGTPYTQKATRLNGYYRYDTIDTYSTGDSAMVAVLLKKYNTITQQVDTIGYGKIHLPFYAPSDETFAAFSVDIDDWDSSQQPDSIVVLLLSSLNGFCANDDDGNCLYFNVDDLSLETPLGTTDISGNKIETEIYPNPAVENVMLKITTEISGENRISITDAAGKTIDEKTIFLNMGINRHEISLENMENGIYFISIQSDSGKKVLRLMKL